MFGAPAGGTTPAGGGMFGQGTPSAPAPAGGGLFGAATPAPAAAPGAGLFGAPSTPAGGSLFGGSASLTPAPAAGGLFGGASAAPAGGLFGSSAQKPTSTAPTSLFGGMGGGMFGGAGGAAVPAAAPAPAEGPKVLLDSDFKALPPEAQKYLKDVEHILLQWGWRSEQPLVEPAALNDTIMLANGACQPPSSAATPHRSPSVSRLCRIAPTSPFLRPASRSPPATPLSLCLLPLHTPHLCIPSLPRSTLSPATRPPRITTGDTIGPAPLYLQTWRGPLLWQGSTSFATSR